MRSAAMLGRGGLRITPRTALVLGGSAVVGFAVAEPARADTTETILQVAGAGLVAAVAYQGYNTMFAGPPEYSECPPYNSAFVFLKPHAATGPAKALVKSGLEEKGFKVLAEGELTGSVIDSKQLIDNHYYSIASKATILEPKELNVPADKFAGKFGLGWQEALDSGKVFNALQACKHLGIDGAALDKKWGAAKKAGDLIKFGGGFYCAFIDGIYIFNGFFMEMRGKYTGDAKINWFVVEWPEDKTSWADFRGQGLGPTDPVDAPAASLRGQIAAQWESLGLPGPCDVGDNGVHASASPFEAMAERCNWLRSTHSISTDPFGKAAIAAGVPESVLADWSVDPQVVYDGKKSSLFDLVEDLDSSACIAKLVDIYKQQ